MEIHIMKYLINYRVPPVKGSTTNNWNQSKNKSIHIISMWNSKYFIYFLFKFLDTLFRWFDTWNSIFVSSTIVG